MYTRVLRLAQPVILVTTPVGAFKWYVDELISQEFVLGTYEPYMQRAFLTYVKSGYVVFDVGAHAGFHTLFCALLVGPKGQVIAFEPCPLNRRTIERQRKFNADLPITVLPYALSDRCGTLTMNTSMGSSQAYVSQTGDLTVESRTIDALVSQGIVPLPQAIKLDVEGHEAQVLAGAVQTLRRYKPVVLCDYNDDTTLREVEELLVPLGYAVLPGPPITAVPAEN
ncbi:MAG TPA: FkbM family methyltransferase [Chloroflexia bacterium]|jgi:FkbM family methyltransferase